jgi:hypothetical protein
MQNLQATRKTPRDSVFVDEFREADEHWAQYFIGNKVWLFMDEYRAELAGDEDYIRIIVFSSADEGWQFSRRLDERERVHSILHSLKSPIAENQLVALGFERFSGSPV